MPNTTPTTIPAPLGSIHVDEWEPNGDSVTRHFRGNSIKINGVYCGIHGQQEAYGGNVLERVLLVEADRGGQELSLDQADEFLAGPCSRLHPSASAGP
jgi:hypothetical protein